MLSVTNHQADADQNHSETSPHPWQKSHDQKQGSVRESVLARMWRTWNLEH